MEEKFRIELVKNMANEHGENLWNEFHAKGLTVYEGMACFSMLAGGIECCLGKVVEEGEKDVSEFKKEFLEMLKRGLSIEE